MNCLNCGAPTTPVAGRHFFICSFCESHRETSRSQATKDGVVSSAELVDADCPVCDHEQLVLAAIDGVDVQHCTGCRGVLIPNERFRELLARRRSNFGEAEDNPIPLNPTELDRQIACPQCQGRMAVHPYHGPGNAVIDSCYPCRHIWLDRGEFSALERAPGVR